MHDWSAPDHRGIRSRISADARSTLKRRRSERAAGAPQPAPIATWPSDWRALAGDWLRSTAGERQWTSLLGIAGNARYPLALQLADALLELGWIELDSRFERGDWRPLRLRWIDADGLREALGLPRIDARAAAIADMRATPPRDPRLHPLHAALADEPASRALSRAALLTRLDDWLDQRRSGTRRDFALFARGDSKAVSEAEWNWLDTGLDLDACGIGRHLPTLWLAAPLGLRIGDARLDLAAVPDVIGLSPATLAAVTAIDGRIGCWRVVENRTSFERVARDARGIDGVLWVPGHPSAWWRGAVTALLRHAPAPARIACDPDPAGIMIAGAVAAVWREAGLDWAPWGMSAEELLAMPITRPLTAHDRSLLDTQPVLPEFGGLAAAMREHGIKGEQEALALRVESQALPGQNAAAS